MKWFPTRLFIACLTIGVASAHIVCKYQRVSLGITKTSAECQTKCIACRHTLIPVGLLETKRLRVVVDADDPETTRDCIAWGHSLKDEKCSGWILENDPEVYAADDDYDSFYIDIYGLAYDSLYSVGSYSDSYYGDYETCALVPHTNISVAHTKGAGDKSGCFFDVENLGYAVTPEDCKAMCEGSKTSRVKWTIFLKPFFCCFSDESTSWRLSCMDAFGGRRRMSRPLVLAD